MSSGLATSFFKVGIISSTCNPMLTSSLGDYNKSLYLHPSESSAPGFKTYEQFRDV